MKTGRAGRGMYMKLSRKKVSIFDLFYSDFLEYWRLEMLAHAARRAPRG